MINFLENLDKKLQEYGLFIRGICPAIETDSVPSSIRSIILVGNTGEALWSVFQDIKKSPSNPLDTWTRETLIPLSEQFSLPVIFPFDQKPTYPFQTWAKRTEPLHTSPPGILLHEKYGLWHAYRGAFLSTEVLPYTHDGVQVISACDSCTDKPCLQSCPTDALAQGRYEFERCAAFLKKDIENNRCLLQGCHARLYCPIGEAYRYPTALRRFHMQKFAYFND